MKHYFIKESGDEVRVGDYLEISWKTDEKGSIGKYYNGELDEKDIGMLIKEGIVESFDDTEDEDEDMGVFNFCPPEAIDRFFSLLSSIEEHVTNLEKKVESLEKKLKNGRGK